MTVELYNDDDNYEWNTEYENRTLPKKFERQHKPRVERRGILRGRVGVKDGLFDLVSSKQSRDIIRRNNFMPGQFEHWINSEKSKGRNPNLWGGYQDRDNDGIAEFVVRRGGEEGPEVAVNGYTTKKSDWLVRRDYYEANPTREQRKETHLRDWVHGEYNPQYKNDGMTLKSFEDIEKWNHKGYNSYKPKDISPYQAFGKYIVFPALQNVIKRFANNNAERAKYVRKVIANVLKQRALESWYLSQAYNVFVKDAINKSIEEANYLESYVKDFLELKASKGYSAEDIEDNTTEAFKEFEKWLYSKADVKRLVKEYVGDLIENHKTELQTKLEQELEKVIRHSIPNLNDLVNKEIHSVYNSLQKRTEEFYDGWDDLETISPPKPKSKNTKKEIAPLSMNTRSKSRKSRKDDDDE